MLKKRLRQGECVIGTWCDIPSPSVANIIAKAGLDFIIIDMEHGPMDFKLAQEMVMAAEAEGREALIRVPLLEESSILRALDTGCSGIMIPRIRNVEDRNQAIRFAKFYPFGNRGYNPYIRAMGYGGEAGTEEKNKDSILAVMLEDEDGVKNLEEILDNEAVDVAYLGIYDLSVAMGFGGDVKETAVKAASEDAIRRIVNAGKIAGCIVHNEAELRYFKKIGVKFLVYRVDSSIIYGAYKQIVAAAKTD